MLTHSAWLENLARWQQKADIAPTGLDGTIWGWTTLEPTGFNSATPQLRDLHGLRRIGCENLSQGRSTSSRPTEGSLHPQVSVPASLLLFQAPWSDDRSSLVYSIYGCLQQKPRRMGLDNRGGDKTATRDSGCFVSNVTAQSEGQDLPESSLRLGDKEWELSRATHTPAPDGADLAAIGGQEPFLLHPAQNKLSKD